MGTGLLGDLGQLEGIGPKKTRALAKLGIKSLLDLLKVPAAQIVHRGAPASIQTIERWQSMAELICVDTVDPQLAEAFTEAGIDSVRELSRTTLTRVNKACRAAHKANRMKGKPSSDQLAAIIRDAAHLTHSSICCGRFLAAKGDAPLAGIKVSVGDASTTTDSEGCFTLAVPGDGPQQLRNPWTRIPIDLDHKHICGPLVFRCPELPRIPEGPMRHERDGSMIFCDGECKLEFVDVDLSTAQEGDLLKVTNILANGDIRLINLWRRQSDRAVFIDRITLSPNAFSKLPKTFDILRLEAGTLVPTGLDQTTVMNERLKLQLGVSGALEFIEHV